jgi:hypothetical protein
MGSTEPSAKKKVHIFYLRDVHGHPRTTVAATVEEAGTVNYALATRNPIDPLSKSVGRHVALGRLTAGKSKRIPCLKEKSSEIIAEVVTDIFTDIHRRLSIRAVAQSWLLSHIQHQQAMARAEKDKNSREQ